MKMHLKATVVPVAIVALLYISSCSHADSRSESDSTKQSDTSVSSAISKESKATLVFVGDAMTHQAQIDEAHKLAGGVGYDFSDCFTLIAPEITNADYAVVNLETPLGGGRGGYTGFPCFSAPDSYAAELKKAGFDLFLTANNHTLDRGDYGLRRTISVLDSLGISHTGTFRNAADREKNVPFIANINGIKVAFLNYTYGTNGLYPHDGAEVSLIDRNAISNEIKSARIAGAEMIAVCVHWGVEYQLHEHPSQRSLAEYLLAEEVDMIIGSHPHVVQPMVMKETPSGKRVPIVYSLGNFLSNMKTDDTRGGAIAYVEISRDAEGNCKVDNMTYDTFYAAKPDPSSRPWCATRNFTVIPSYMAPDSIPVSQRGWWDTFNRRSTHLFDTSNIDVPRYNR